MKKISSLQIFIIGILFVTYIQAQEVTNPGFHEETGFPLPFLEQWNDGTFGTNNWLAEAENWSINWQEGQPGPSAQFTWDPIQTDYSISLESYPLLADSLAVGEIYLDFDLKLDNFQPTGSEQMLVQVWNWDSQEWSTVSGYSNEDGSFDWLSEHLNISDQALGKVFKIRFAATGENSLNIVGWYVDNIHVYRECEQPENLTVYWDYNWGHMGLDWDGPDDWEDVWMQWDDGENSGNSIGGPLIFDVAARWVPAQLDYFDGAELTQISFFPGEELATYSVRVWIGPEEPQLVVDQLVENPVINQWNTIELNNPPQIDINQDLWVGYHIDCETGYPAGVDDGPGIDGYGNMIYYGGWSTLLEINPELDYNWNIAAHFQKDSTLSNLAKFAIYRSDDQGPYFLRDYSEQSFYQDDSICWEVPHLVFTYKVSALYISENDTCTSGFSNEDGDICEGIGENENLPVISIYPNPASDLIYIESEQNIENLTIFDSRGITIEQWNSGTMEPGDGGQVVGWSGGRVVVPVDGLPPGLYLVRVETAGGIMAKKVVVGR